MTKPSNEVKRNKAMPSCSRQRTAWFKDPDGNILHINNH
jgi:hypothetical protein